jgi:hypothetical protein
VKCEQELRSLLKNGNLNPIGISSFLEVLRLQYNQTYNRQSDEIEAKKKQIGIDNYTALRNRYMNEALTDQATNRLEKDKAVIENSEIHRKDAPIYYENKNLRFLDAPFYSPVKYVFGYKLNTFWANIIVLWVFVIISFVALYYNMLELGMNTYARWKEKTFKK